MIDVKELRIGSYVLVNGVRARVIAIGKWYQFYHLTCMAIIDGELRKCGSYVDSGHIEPIPITEELLSELGFVKETLPHLPFELIRYIDGESARCREVHKPAVVVPRITLDYAGRIPTPFWQATVLDDKVTQCRADINYLHELENFVYLTTKTELIKD